MKAAKIALLALLVVGSAGAAGTSGSPGFKASREFDTSAKGTNSVALGDLNGDGKLDVVAAHGAFDDDPPALQRLRLVSVLYGRGDGRLGPSHEYEIGKPGDIRGAFSIAMGDLTGDGKPDVVTGNLDAKTVSVLVTSAQGTLEAPVNYSLGREPWDVAVDDLNGDGKLDIATGNPNTVSILLNEGDGTFGATHEYPAGRGSWAFAVGDLSGDGRPDIATADRRRSTTTVLVNHGDGSFGAPVDYRTGAWAGHGRDRRRQRRRQRRPGVGERQHGSERRRRVARLSLRPPRKRRRHAATEARLPACETMEQRDFVTVRIGDVNGDRKPDLVTADLGDDWSMTVFVNGGKGTFRRHFDFGRNDYTSQEVGPGSEAVALGDLNGDRRLDVVEARSDEVSVFVNAPGMCTVPDVFGDEARSGQAAARREALLPSERSNGRRTATPGLRLAATAERGSGPAQGREGDAVRSGASR